MWFIMKISFIESMIIKIEVCWCGVEDFGLEGSYEGCLFSFVVGLLVN